MSFHGTPCWFELATSDLDAAKSFYGAVFGWETSDSVMPDFEYRLASAGKDKVAGMMPLEMCPEGVPPNWLVYFAVDNCEAAAMDVAEAGGHVLQEPTVIPRTGQFAVLADPQGAVFGILEPEPMDTPPEGGAWDQRAAGHGNWLELMSTDPQAGMAFYCRLLGWAPDQAMDMGAMGKYHLFTHHGAQIGGMMGLGPAPVPNWLPYFGVDDVAAAIKAIRGNGGTLSNGPVEVPGPALICVAQDPQGAWFAIVGPKP